MTRNNESNHMCARDWRTAQQSDRTHALKANVLAIIFMKCGGLIRPFAGGVGLCGVLASREVTNGFVGFANFLTGETVDSGCIYT
jgi:hypothetical protein